MDLSQYDTQITTFVQIVTLLMSAISGYVALRYCHQAAFLCVITQKCDVPVL